MTIVVSPVNVVVVPVFVIAGTANLVTGAASTFTCAPNVVGGQAKTLALEATAFAVTPKVVARTVTMLGDTATTFARTATTFADPAIVLTREAKTFTRKESIEKQEAKTRNRNRHEKEEDTMTITSAVHRSVVTMKTSVPVMTLVAFALHLVAKMTSNPAFPAPAPTLAAITAAANDLAAAEQSASQKTKGAVTVRDDRRAVLVTMLQQIKSYVQTQADANLESGQAIIESAGMTVKKAVTRKARVFGAKAGATTGSVLLTAPSAGARAAYDWQYSIDGGKTWVAAPSTLQARRTVSGLTAGATVMFRYQSLIKTGEGDWSQPVSIIVK
ncbi:MAG TPA: hypothetical protein VIF09_22030 [Polyangiaceae bacterium]